MPPEPKSHLTSHPALKRNPSMPLPSWCHLQNEARRVKPEKLGSVALVFQGAARWVWEEKI